MEKLFDIVHEDEELLVINKPAGLVCHPTKGDVYSSLISRVRLHLGAEKPAHMINRLDRETSGIVVVAKNYETAGTLGKIWENRAVRKKYLAIAHGHLQEEQGIITQPLGRDEASCVAVKDCVRSDGAASQTEYQVERRFENARGKFSLVHVTPRTGRKHQIRIHLQFIGHPIVGDKLYGGDEMVYLALVKGQLTDEQRGQLILPHQALHAAELNFTLSGEEKTFRAEPEKWFSEFIQSP